MKTKNYVCNFIKLKKISEVNKNKYEIPGIMILRVLFNCNCNQYDGKEQLSSFILVIQLSKIAGIIVSYDTLETFKLCVNKK